MPTGASVGRGAVNSILQLEAASTCHPDWSEAQFRHPDRSEVQTRHPDRSEVQFRHPDRSEAEWRDLLVSGPQGVVPVAELRGTERFLDELGTTVGVRCG